MLVRYSATPSTGDGHPVSLTFTGNSITITGAPIATVTYPPNDGVLNPGDTIQGVFSHPSGVDSTTYKIFVDGHDSTASAHTHRTGSTLWANLTLLGGSHSIKTWGCAKNSPVRCDTSVVVVAAEAAPPTLWQLDDSLAPNTDARFGWVPGGVPLPPTNLLGCPVTLGDPTINVTDPASYEGQLNGNVFVAPIIWDDSIHINAVTHARLPNDTANVCSHQTTFPFLQDSLFDWTFWPHSDPHDTLWYSYPYHDRTPAAIAQTIGAPPQGGGFANSMAVVPGHGTAPGTQPPGSGLLLLPQSGVTSMPVVRPFLQNGGGIDTNSYNVTLNGDTIIKHGKPVAGKGVVEQGLATATSLYSMSTGHTNVNIYDPVRPDTSHNGGWNELIASIADTLGHRTSIRSRFVVVKSPTPVASFRPQALRNLSHLDQSDCAAFGAFQCGGTILSQTIPGFVTRDRDRSLHLVYRSASQKAPVILPFGISISRLQLAPDSFLVSAHEGAVRLPDSLRYIGAGIPSGVSRAESLTALSQEATAYRVLGSDVPAAATTHAIRTITTVFHPLYAGVAVEDSVTQEVVQLYLTDTTTGRFGPGWALGELSRLVFGDMSQGAPAAIWLDGDGSYQIFRKVSGVWTAPPGLSVRLDTTTQTSSDSAKYTLALGSGAMVGFRSDGWQVWTQDLVGNRTTFTYAPSTTRLVKITDPTGVTDSLLYNAANASGQVSDIFMIGRNGGADTARVASFAYDTTRRLIKSTILRSGSGTVGVRGDTTRFGYVTATAYGALLDTIVDPRSTASVPILTTFQYDSLYALPIVEKRPPDRYGVDSISIRFPWRRAVPRVGYGRRNANGTLQIAERLVAVNQYVGTHIDYDNNATDFAMGWFGSPTYVRNIAPPPVFGGAFLIIGNGGDNVRRVTHDSLGRVTKIVQSPDSTTITDSVMYHYDALNRVDQISRRTAAYPAAAGALDTVSFKYDSVTLAGGAWCSRMDTTVDVMKKRTYVIYGGTGTGVKQCLPLMVIGLARDTTSFTYGSLLKGDSAGVRPISTTDPTHVTQTMQYDHNTWNSAISTRSADTAVSRAFYNPWGRPDSTVAPDGARTFYRYDLSGRVRDTKTGLGSSVPTTRTFFNHGGLPDSVKVYASGDNFAAGNDTTPLGSPTPQNTRYYYDRLGFVDSSFTPGGRHLHYLRDRLGNPIWEYPGNGTYIVRVYDWMGRVTAETQSQVDPSYSVDGLAFADATTKSVYQAQRFQVGLTLSGPVWHAFTYGNRGWLGELDDTVSHRSTAYDAAGGIISDQVHFTDGATVRRTYQYNKRGQRTLAVTSVFGVTVAEPADTTSYFYSDSSGRLDSLQMSGSNGYKVARAVWAYDRAGRDSVQRVAIGKSTSYLTWEDSTLSQYDAAGRLARWQNRTSGFTNAWYDFRSPAYDHADQLKSYAGTEPVAGGLTPTNFDASVSYTMSYATDGSRRLLVSTKSGGTPITHTYRYDTFGNRLSDFAGTGCAQLYTYGPDNQLLRRADSTSACANHRGVYWTDAVGNRLEEVDTADGQGPTAPQLMSYTARNQLFFSQTASVITGMYDFNWHYYDGKGLREESVVSNGQAYLPGSYTAPDSGQHSYYFYDGPNVALVLV
ncbi:MAG TPA: hypothetical protein VFD85_05320, partial [Gemmatimonadales bacterium]|nr:hypothetical protein [Gemmatimonadales bacterium]